MLCPLSHEHDGQVNLAIITSYRQFVFYLFIRKQTKIQLKG